MASTTRGAEWTDVRGKGFSERASLGDALAWVDRVTPCAEEERIAPSAAVGRLLACDVEAAEDLPPVDRAAMDGYGVHARETEGASAYNPMSFGLAEAPGDGSATSLSAGDRLPEKADAVIGFASVVRRGSDRIDVLAPIAPGEGIEPRASALAVGERAFRAGHRILPQDLALLAMLGVTEVAVFRRPRIAIVLPGPKAVGAEALLGMLGALLARDGAETLSPAWQAAAPFPDAADALIIAGRSGAGEDDSSVPELVAAGASIAMHGIALRPGASTALGTLNGRPLLVLPGEPLACFTAYDLIGGRMIRRLAHLPAELPYPTMRVPLARKVVSGIGFTDVVPAAISGGQAVPLARPETAHLPTTRRAAGFIVVPEALEGFAPGETVTLHLYASGDPLL